MPSTPSSNGRYPRLRVTDFSDRELLAIVADIEAKDGEADIVVVAEQIWPRTMQDEEAAWHARHSVSIRFAYMRRKLGVIDRVEGKHGVWWLTEFGWEFVRGHASQRQINAIQGSQPGQELALMALVGELYEHVDDDAAALMRREFQFRAHRRRWG